MVGVRNNRLKQGTASIRSNYEGDGGDSDEDEQLSKSRIPGPGHYMTQDSTFKSRIRPNSL